MQPSIGLDIGGLLVTVFGSNFVRGSGLQCRFGADAVVSAVFRSSGRLECVQPAMSAGNTSVAVSIITWLSPPGLFGRVDLQIRGGDFEGTPHSCLVEKSSFTYSPMPKVLIVRPAMGYSIGGLYVIVQFAWPGLALQDSTSCGCFFSVTSGLQLPHKTVLTFRASYHSSKVHVPVF